MKNVLFAGIAATLFSETYGARSLPFAKKAPGFTGASFSAQRGIGLVPHRSSKVVDAAQGSSLGDSGDLLYLLNITLGGQPFTCQIDTGSSDLWVIPADKQPVKTVNTTEVAASITYADGSGVSGFIDFAELIVGGYNISSQAFINPNHTTNLEQLLGGPETGMNCLIGLSFDLLSEVNTNILRAFGNTTIGQTPLSNIFDQHPTLPNTLDLHLQRSSDLEYTDKGLLLVGEHSIERGDITKQPKLVTVAETEWLVEVDAINVNGKSLAFNKSFVPSLSNTNKLGGVLDSGTSALVLPDEMVEEVFGAIPGSFFFEHENTWFVDCMSSANISITMGGIEHHIHPLDLTRMQIVDFTIKGKKESVTVCSGFVDPVGDACGSNCDLVMGDVFLRNTITSFNFGNWTQATTPNDGSFAQLMPLTNQLDAWADFLATRATNLKSLPRAPSMAEFQELIAQDDDFSNSSNPSSTDDKSSESEHLTSNKTGAKSALADSPSSSSDSQILSLVKQYGPAIVGLLAGNILIGIILVAVGVVTCLRRGGGVGIGGGKTRSGLFTIIKYLTAYLTVTYVHTSTLVDRKGHIREVTDSDLETPDALPLIWSNPTIYFSRSSCSPILNYFTHYLCSPISYMYANTSFMSRNGALEKRGSAGTGLYGCGVAISLRALAFAVNPPVIVLGMSATLEGRYCLMPSSFKYPTPLKLEKIPPNAKAL
ncbi:aspartic peptidase domain-containing protein [Irpex rosettiformis]|uniref:Aspartic peptidase domain-containing protein n=1 Tax=Irpex rosettiformis TaxID=378272 RepID=A0ACB8TRQ0_9APHY|nr:aspartic peptidase domain-containing protein [Irpex rosettiformis]